MHYPKISIVTPSYNQGKFIEETILSVIGQSYPNLEYIIIDGGSTDETMDIIKKYEKHLTYWVSEKDKGQSHAINKGFALATGEIMAWLNSDDIYLPGTLSYIANLVDVTQACIHFGNCIHFRETENGLVSFGSNVLLEHNSTQLTFLDYIIQPSSFWTRRTWTETGELREDLHFGFDWEWFLRAQASGVNFIPISRGLSMYRIHDAHKTATGGTHRRQELLTVYSEYSESAAMLYKHLMSETIPLTSFKSKVLIVLLKLLKRPASYPYILRLCKPGKYKKYSVKEITVVKSML